MVLLKAKYRWHYEHQPQNRTNFDNKYSIKTYHSIVLRMNIDFRQFYHIFNMRQQSFYICFFVLLSANRQNLKSTLQLSHGQNRKN